MEGIKNAEAEESRGTGARKGGHISGGGIKVSIPPDAVAALNKMAHGGELGLVQLVRKTSPTRISSHAPCLGG